MTPDEFDRQFKRYKVLGEFHSAFMFCLDNLNTPVGENARQYATQLIRDKKYEVLLPDGSRRLIKIPTKLDNNWLLDIAVRMGYGEVQRDTISTGFFSKVPCIMIGGMFSKQRFATRAEKDGSTTIFYTQGSWTDDYKLISAICNEIVNILDFRR